MSTYGLTIPLGSIPLREHQEFLKEVERLGYEELWSAEVDGYDAFTPLALASAWVPSMGLGTAIVPAFTRGPGLVAMQAATIAALAPGRFTLGVGSSSNVIVERWNGIEFERPFQRTRDLTRFLKLALSGEKVSQEFESFTIDGFKLAIALEEPPKVLVAALREGMLKMAGREGDGAIINWLSPGDALKVVPIVGAGKRIVARIFVCPNPDADLVRSMGRRAIAAYLNVPVYAEFHRWLGRGEVLGGMWEAWRAGDRKEALAQIPDSVVDDLIVHGSPEECQARIDAYFNAGVDVAALAMMPFGISEVDAVRALAPRARRG